ncbi:DNA-binding transcriptional regulator, MarR family [Tistlia consotensis]|uniref:DNA-binding transcriptional regulator, MarR family n=1 Tax=Tistlia consotensis USBA 355 TaxID=560819 RepID=A0A1Y6CM58_9PROT|nr:MarR family transcriptional regulator [Tistlia consotensis]SMF75555.1 DNA-binding transcriptional regulator, MarR family [Tistlia consotensis USBA 355]SNS07865.1 DNA-binding transcriptional regulator, MarR family [Tistlia consotensis]
MPKHPVKPTDQTTQAILAHWREAVPNDRLAHLVRDAARGLTRALQLRLAEHGVSFGHWSFLRILWARDGITQRDLSVQAGLMEPTTHSAILRMEELGYVVRRHPEGNRRKLHIFLTEQGRRLEKVLVPLAEQVNAMSVEGVPPAEVETTRRVLLAMIQNLAVDEAAALDQGQRMPSTRSLGRRGRGGEEG